jgi:putative membrane protein insertion efficiency factor
VNLAQHILVAAVRFYRWVISPAKDALFGPPAQCRFEPCCSAYALQAVQTHGACKGSWLAIRRLARCHPWGPFGLDPVPPKEQRSHAHCVDCI